MAIQARAEATRNGILAAAVRLFGKAGYGSTALSDVIGEAGVTKGAAYYHFPTKESVALALMERSDAKVAETVEAVLAQPGSALEKVIRATFVVADLSHSDPAVHVGLQLRHGLPQISSSATGAYTAQQMVGIAALRQAVAEGDLRPGIDPDMAGRTIHAAVVGTHITCAATGTHPREGLVTMWHFLLQGMLAESSAEFLTPFLGRFDRRNTSPA